jgi:uncharacterized membrane protein YuzA (DUF378 family)
MQHSMRALDILAATLLVLGGLNWGAVAIFGWDFISNFSGLSFGQLGTLNRIVFGSFGAAALYQAMALPSLWRRWGIEGEPGAARNP